QELARELAARMAPDALLDAADVGALLGCSPRYVTEQYVLAPGFPTAIRLTGAGGRRGKPRWKRSDIMAWIDRDPGARTKLGGRPRKNNNSKNKFPCFPKRPISQKLRHPWCLSCAPNIRTSHPRKSLNYEGFLFCAAWAFGETFYTKTRLSP